MKIPIELSRKKSAYSVYVYGALDVRLFPNKRLNVDLKNIEIWVSHGLNWLPKPPFIYIYFFKVYWIFLMFDSLNPFHIYIIYIFNSNISLFNLKKIFSIASFFFDKTRYYQNFLYYVA